MSLQSLRNRNRPLIMWAMVIFALSGLLYSDSNGSLSGDPAVPVVFTLVGIGFGTYAVIVQSKRFTGPSAKQMACNFFAVALAACGVVHCIFAVEHEGPGPGYVLLLADAGVTALAAIFAHEFHYPPAGKVVLCLTSPVAHLVVPVWRVGRTFEVLTFCTAAAIGAMAGHARERALRLTFLDGLHGITVQTAADVADAEPQPNKAPAAHAEPQAPKPPAPAADTGPTAQAPATPIHNELQAPAPTIDLEAKAQHQALADPQAERCRKRPKRDEAPPPPTITSPAPPVLVVSCTGCKQMLKLPVTIEELRGKQVQCATCLTVMSPVGLPWGATGCCRLLATDDYPIFDDLEESKFAGHFGAGILDLE